MCFTFVTFLFHFGFILCYTLVSGVFHLGFLKFDFCFFCHYFYFSFLYVLQTQNQYQTKSCLFLLITVKQDLYHLKYKVNFFYIFIFFISPHYVVIEMYLHLRQ